MLVDNRSPWHLGGAERANYDLIVQRAQQAYGANRTFLALGAPTNAQTLAQVQRLTRQVNTLLKLTFGDLADADDT